jgi:PAS domain S-box-containing protein
MTNPGDPTMVLPASHRRDRRFLPAPQPARPPLDAYLLFERMGDAVTCCSLDGTIVYTNPAAEHAFGRLDATPVGRNFWHLLPELVSGPLHEGFTKLAQEGGSTTLEHHFPRAHRWYAITLYRIGDLICLIGRDITKHKQVEAEREQHLRELERSLYFDDMFVGILSHDLRNPLSAIATAANLVLRRAPNERLAVPAQRILDSGARMGRMIDQLLDFTRIRLGGGLPLSRQPMDLNELCHQVADELAATGRHGPLHLSCAGDCRGEWDRDRLWQLIANVAGNALQHGVHGAPVHLSLDGTGEDEVWLQVQNAGIIPPARQATIFEPLKSAHKDKRTGSSGLGLGLFISQQIALAHEGSIEIHSNRELGTRLLVRLPRQGAANAAFATQA